MLSEQFLPREKLVDAANVIRSGQQISFPPAMQAAVVAAMATAKAKAKAAQANQGSPGLGLAFVAIIALLLFGIFNSWPHYQWASFRDNVPTYQGFVVRFPDSDYTPSANERIRVLREDEVWNEAQARNEIEAFRGYVKVYPDGKNLGRAKQRITEFADFVWEGISNSRSEPEIRRFVRQYPETSKLAATEARIQELFNDWDWVREQDTLEHYRRFASRFPFHAQRGWFEKRIIDLEVDQIAAGDYGILPRAQPVAGSFDVQDAEVSVENGTGYELTVRYSGRDSKKIVIPIGRTQTISLPIGSYRVAASVNAFNVRNYYGTDDMKAGRYESRFYVQSSLAPNFIPSHGGSSTSTRSPSPRKRK